MPFSVPATVPLDENEMKLMFEAFDADHSGALDKSEVSQILESAGLTELKRTAVLEQMFKDDQNSDGMGWDVFRLWLRREGFADRKLNWQEQVYITLDEPGSSKVAMTVGIFIVVLIIASVITFMLESLPSLRTQSHCEYVNGTQSHCRPEVDSPSLELFETVVIIVRLPNRILSSMC
jgi:hypothetical protein